MCFKRRGDERVVKMALFRSCMNVSPTSNSKGQLCLKIAQKQHNQKVSVFLEVTVSIDMFRQHPTFLKTIGKKFRARLPALG